MRVAGDHETRPPVSRPWFGYLPPQDVHCNEFPTTADFWYDVHTRKTTTDLCTCIRT